MKKEDFRSITKEARNERRRLAIKLIEKGETKSAVAKLLGVRPNTITVWYKKHQESGTSGLKEAVRGRKEGEKTKLSKEQECELSSLITDNHPEQLKMPFALWTRAAIQELIKQRFNILMPIRTVGYYLHRLGFTPKKPVKKAYEQQPEAIKKWLDNSYPAIKKRAKEENAEIFWADETGVNNAPNVCKGYSKIGTKPVLEVSGKKISVSMISAITNGGCLSYMIYKGAMNISIFIDFLRRLTVYAKRKVFLVLDNLKVHHAKKVQAWVEKYKDRIELFFLPPYSPEHNPDEYVNQHLKQALSNKPRQRTEEKLKNNLRSHMKKLQRNKAKIISFFEHQKVKYAKES